MRVSKTHILVLALAASVALGVFNAAEAKHRKQTAQSTSSGEAAFWGGLTRTGSGIRTENGVPIIMKGYHLAPSATREDTGPERRVDRPVKIPRGSSSYIDIPPPVPSPYSRNSPPAASLTQPAPAPYQPAPITTYSDRVTGALHDYPLQRGIGNNPMDQQQFIRQRLNQ